MDKIITLIRKAIIKHELKKTIIIILLLQAEKVNWL